MDKFLDELTAQYIPKIDPSLSYKKKLKAVSNEAYWEAMKNVLKQAYTRNIFNKLINNELEIFQGIKDNQLQMLEEEADRLTTKSPFWFLTINPRQDVSLSLLKKKVKKMVSKKCIISYAYVYEVRKYEEKDYKGLHCHILLEQKDKPYNFKRGCKSTFKDICDFNNPHILNFKNIKDMEMLKEKYEYIKGNKKTKKLKGVQLSKEFRKLNNLQDMYNSSPPLPCGTTEKFLLKNDAKPSCSNGTENDDGNDE